MIIVLGNSLYLHAGFVVIDLYRDGRSRKARGNILRAS